MLERTRICNALSTITAAVLLGGCGVSPSTFGPSENTQETRTTLVKAPSSSYQSLFSFSGSNGANPSASLTALNGTLYGTTQSGGATARCKSCGTVFSVTTTGQEAVLHSFSGEPDGADPVANVIAVDGTLYGTTLAGGGGKCKLFGNKGCGTIYRISPSGSEYTVLYAFKGKGDGAFPRAGLTFFRGKLYGTAMSGGKHGLGTAFSITTGGTFSALHAFSYSSDDGRIPITGLTLFKNAIYGTTSLGGSYGYGSAYRLTASGKFRVFYNFNCTYCIGGSYPSALTLQDGVFYGTTSPVANYHYGMALSLTPGGSDQLLYTFQGGSDGAFPNGVTALNNAFYGTTQQGGGGSCGSVGCGTVFELTASGSESVLYSFQGGTDGANPPAPLIAVNDVLYGTTSNGGSSKDGTIFSIAP